MGQRRTTMHGLKLLGAAGLVFAALAGCSGDDGPAGPAGTQGVVTAPAAGSTALTIAITSASVSSKPVVDFRVVNQRGESVIGMAETDFRFNIAKLVPGSYGNPASWQSYLNRVSGGGVLGTQERKATGSAWGTLADHGDGSYTYTFATDITSATANPCPAPCTDADGNRLDISFQAHLTHRVGIQQNNATLPAANAVYDFVPTGAPASQREIVKTAKCNGCHNPLAAHGGGLRVDTRLCVTCHNPGSWDNSPGNRQTVDFKVMIHKIHRGENLPSVVAGGTYKVISADYSTVVFPQDVRNCTKCHDGSDAATPQGDNWKTRPSREACGSCHDNVNFATGAGHAGGAKDNSTCVGCHSSGGMVGPVEVSHSIPGAAESKKFKFNIVSVTGTTTPVVKFSVTDPSNGDAPYNITTHSAFTQVPSGVSRLAITVGWSAKDFKNASSNSNPGQPITVYPTPTCGGPASGGAPASTDWVCTGPVSGVYTLTKQTALPAAATGTARVSIDGHPAAQDASGAWTVRVPVKNVFKDLAVTGTATARRQVVDIAKCDGCHAQLSLHGNNRTDEPQVCVVCHNPNATDVNRRPKTGGVPDATLAADGKKMQAIDFKVLIHAIHGADKRSADDPNAKLVVYGFGNTANDFSEVRFPGNLSDCSACHVAGTAAPVAGVGTYELSGTWDPLNTDSRLPALYSDLQGTSVDAAPTAVDAATLATQLADQTDDLRVSPTAAVCSSCHTGSTALNHMAVYGGIGVGTTPPATQATISANPEGCVLCHAPGKIADVKVMHGVQ